MSMRRSWLEVSLKNYKRNIEKILSFLPPKTQFMQIVKANAYGHGDFEIAKASIKIGASFLGVANTQEGKRLRLKGIEKTPILVLSPCFDFEIPSIKKYNLIPSISSISFAKKFVGRAHINIETGMGRAGLLGGAKSIEKIKKLPNIQIDGVFSHFAASENNPEFTLEQEKKFEKIITSLSFKPKYIHIANSAGVLSGRHKITNMVRIGLMSFGVQIGFTEKISLLPVLSFKSRVALIKVAQEGESIGYNRTYIAKKHLEYAVIPIGYADGYNYLLMNKAHVLINEKLYPIIGKISMDMICVKIDKKFVKLGDIVILQGWQNKKLYPESLAKLYNGSPYEICCQIGKRAQRNFLHSD